MALTDGDIGARVRRWRSRRGLTQRTLAELAGFTQGYIAQIEAGTARLDKRSSQLAIAEALQISAAELTGNREDFSILPLSRAKGALPALRSALMSLSWRQPNDLSNEQPLSNARPDLMEIARLHTGCRFDLLLPALAEAIAGLQHRRRIAGESASRVDLRALVSLTQYATWACTCLGNFDLATIAAERCWNLAQELDEPAYVGIGSYALIQSLTVNDVKLADQIVGTAFESLQPHVHQNSEVAPMCGMLHLALAHSFAMRGRREPALSHIREAADLAALVGECSFRWHYFGPTNVAIWRMGIMLELGDAAQAVSDGVKPDLVDSVERQARFYMYKGRALAQSRNGSVDAVSALLRAEALAPQLVRPNERVQATVRTLLVRQPHFVT